MEAFLTKEEWVAQNNRVAEHAATLKDHGERVKHVEMAMFGDEMFPETVRNAILPTMTRLNTWLDMMGSVWRVFVGAVASAAAIAVVVKTMGWI
jgi:hypothetical protein